MAAAFQRSNVESFTVRTRVFSVALGDEGRVLADAEY